MAYSEVPILTAWIGLAAYTFHIYFDFSAYSDMAIGLGHIRNIFIVWLLTGIWHGASSNFLMWGVYYGILLLAEKFIFGKHLEKIPVLFQHVYCMFCVMLGWNLFVFDNTAQGIEFLKSLFGLYGQGFLNSETWILAKLTGKDIIPAIVKNYRF